MRVRTVIAIAIGILITVSGLAGAQSGGNYELAWYTVDNGGVSFSTGDGYQLGGTIGQPDAGSLSGGDYTLMGGFWQSGVTSGALEYYIYLPLVLRNG
jgi:hypothetical protein